MKGDLYQGQEQALKRKKVKADTVETEKEYQDGSVKLSAIEQFILDLIKPYCKRKSVFCQENLMGLRDEIQADIAEAFNDDLADAVHTFTCERISKLIGILKLKLLLRLKKTILVVAFCLAHTVNMRSKRLEYWLRIKGDRASK